MNDPGCEELLVAACEAGADLIGGCALYGQRSAWPDRAHLRDRAASSTSTSTSISISVSIHPRSRSRRRSAGRPTHDRLAAAASRSGMSPSCRRCRGRSSTPSPSGLADAGVAVTVLPSTDLFLMGRGHDAQRAARRRRRPTSCSSHGVTCSLSTNNVLNPFTPFGDCSLVRMANLYANIAQVGACRRHGPVPDMVTDAARQADEPADYGIAAGNPADLVVLDCEAPPRRSPNWRSRCWCSSAVQMTVSRPAATLMRPAPGRRIPLRLEIS